MVYQPKPIDVTAANVTPDILELTELLARNVHEMWATQRLADGWRYGPRRDDARKEHPCLVPYESLPESEKEVDRQSALGTLKAIIALGYRVTKT
jgi:ryanodine receptor 2